MADEILAFLNDKVTCIGRDPYPTVQYICRTDCGVVGIGKTAIESVVNAMQKVNDDDGIGGKNNGRTFTD